MENPEGEQGALVLGAVEIAGKEVDHVVQLHLGLRHLIGFLGWSGDSLCGHGSFLSADSSFVRLLLLFATTALSSHKV
jgi:hypothetical protein